MYSLNICGTSSTECATDPDGITSGMAVQTKTGPTGGGCYVLSQYDDSVSSANWSPCKFLSGLRFKFCSTCLTCAFLIIFKSNWDLAVYR